MNDEGKEGSGAAPLDRARWEENVARWQLAEAEFARDPAEGLRAAERLLIEWSGVSGASPTRIVRDMTWNREHSLGGGPAGVDADPIAALTDLGRGLLESARMVQQAQAAARGISAAREHRSASREDFQQAMELYREASARLLGVTRDQLEALGSGAETPASGSRPPQTDGPVADEAVRDRIIAEKLVRESMIPLEQAERRADRWRSTRWAMVQMVGSLLVGLVMLAAVIWVLSL